MSTRPFPRPVLLLTLGALATPAWAVGCDELRDSIGARIRAGGVGSFSLTVVAADASAPGAVVGRCELGAKKILYVKGVAAAVPTPSTAPSAPAAKPKAAAPEVITECDDGSSVTHGECKK